MGRGTSGQGEGAPRRPHDARPVHPRCTPSKGPRVARNAMKTSAMCGPWTLRSWGDVPRRPPGARASPRRPCGAPSRPRRTPADAFGRSQRAQTGWPHANRRRRAADSGWGRAQRSKDRPPRAPDHPSGPRRRYVIECWGAMASPRGARGTSARASQPRQSCSARSISSWWKPTSMRLRTERIGMPRALTLAARARLIISSYASTSESTSRKRTGMLRPRK